MKEKKRHPQPPLRTLHPTARFILPAAIVLIIFAAHTAASAAKTSSVRFDFYLPPSLLGKGSSEVWAQIERLNSIIQSTSGLRITIRRTSSLEDAINRIEKGQTDLTYVPPYYYAKQITLNPRTAIVPLATFSINNSIASKICIYMMPEKMQPNPDEQLDQLFSTKIALEDESAWVLLNLIFYRNKYIFDPSYYFASFHTVNKESAAYATSLGALDAFVAPERILKLISTTDPRLTRATPVSCSEPLPGTMIAYRRGLPPATVAQVKKTLLDLNRLAALAGASSYFDTLGDGHFTTITEKDYKPWINIYKLARSYGWDNSYKKIAKSN